MQDQRAERDRSGAGVVGRLVGSAVGLLLAGAAAWAVWWLRAPFVPSWMECALHSVPVAARLHLEGPLLAMATGVSVLLLLWLLPWLRRRTDALALAAAVVFATGATLLVGATQPLVAGFLPRLASSEVLWWAAGGVLVFAVLTAPLLRDRGLLALLLVPVFAASCGLIAIGHTRLEAIEAAPIQALQAAAPTVSPVALVLPADTPSVLVDGLVAALRRPAHAIDLDVLTIPPDGIESTWLQRMGVDRLVVRGNVVDVLPGAHSNQRLAAGVLRLDAGFAGPGPRDGLFVRSGTELAHSHTCVFTPYGCLHGELGDNGAMALPAAAEQQLRTIVAALPSGTAIRVLVVSPVEADAYGWLDLLLP